MHRVLLHNLSVIRKGPSNRVSSRFYATNRPFSPLRILFCGSDEFSIASLKALQFEHQRDPEFISSIDVVCRPGKRTGRGLKNIREGKLVLCTHPHRKLIRPIVPIANIARDLSLPLHQINTFTGWTPPLSKDCTKINLIIAVSFGLLVPPRLLNLAKYGGLNVHPSLLPDFRGAAPLHHTLLSSCTKTGITLQTLHPSRMDHGQILAQTPSPYISIPNAENASVQELTSLLAPMGAEMLIEGLRDGLFVHPVQSVTLAEGEARLASKIMPEDRHIDWSIMPADEIQRRSRVIGPLWSLAVGPDLKKQRIIWSTGFDIVPGIELNDTPGVAHVAPGNTGILIPTVDGLTLKAEFITVEGFEKKSSAQIASKAGLIAKTEGEKSGHEKIESVEIDYAKFWNPFI